VLVVVAGEDVLEQQSLSFAERCVGEVAGDDVRDGIDRAYTQLCE